MPVFEKNFTERDIRPQDLFEEYLRLTAADATRMKAHYEKFLAVNCPGCGSADQDIAFLKGGFSFCLCTKCRSLFCSPRPSGHQLAAFYSSSDSARYWVNTFFPAVMEIRRKKLFEPKGKAIFELMTTRGCVPQAVCDVGAGNGLLLEEMKKYWRDAHLLAVEPSQAAAQICINKGFEVMKTSVEDCDWRDAADLVTSLEVLEHVFSPIEFVGAVYRIVKPGGYCLVTTLGGDGFDIQVLQADSKAVSPPHHLNFLSVQGFESLFARAGFRDVLITTPGQLDVEIVQNTIDENPDIRLTGFVKTLLERGGQVCLDFQEFLVKHKMSSHIWILAQK